MHGSRPWGFDYHLAADGISLTLLVLTGLASTAGVLFSWNIRERAGEFFALFLTLVAGVYGVFLSADALLFFAFYEIAIVPKYFLIAIWGSTNREYGAMKLALYSFAGSAMVLAGLLWVYAAGGGHGFGFGDLAQAAATLPRHQQIVDLRVRLLRFRNACGSFPAPHVGAHGPRGRPDRSLDAPGRRRHEARRVRLPSRRPAPLAGRVRLLADPHRVAGRRRHRLRGARRAHAGRTSSSSSATQA